MKDHGEDFPVYETEEPFLGDHLALILTFNAYWLERKSKISIYKFKHPPEKDYLGEDDELYIKLGAITQGRNELGASRKLAPGECIEFRMAGLL